MKHRGQCHCGEIRVEFDSVATLPPRACQCRFCRRHDARMVSDPDGQVILIVGPDTRRYRFGSQTTDYLFCGRCGIYVGAVARLDGRLYATENLNAFDHPRAELTATPVFYEAESVRAKADRRRRKWTRPGSSKAEPPASSK